MVLLFAVARLFTPTIASYYEDHYKSKGVKFIKGTVLSSFDMDSNGKVYLNLLNNLKRIYLKLICVKEVFGHENGHYGHCRFNVLLIWITRSRRFFFF